MADDRPVEDLTAQLARVTRELDDLASTVLARLTSRPTGSIEATLRTTAPAGALFMRGQSVAKATYPALWKWAQDQGLVATNLFADSGTTFTLPDMRGRVLRGATGTTGALTGADTITLTTAQLPAHTHGSAGTHGGHFPASAFVLAPGGTTFGFPAWNDSGSNDGSHTHSSVGSGAAVDVRQAGIDVNWIIYT